MIYTKGYSWYVGITNLLLSYHSEHFSFLSTLSNWCVSVCGDTSVLTGQVTDSTNVPIGGARVASADRPDIVLAMTGLDGMFTITRFCSQPQTMVVTKHMFTTFRGETTQIDSITSHFHAIIEIMGTFFKYAFIVCIICIKWFLWTLV